MKRFGKIFFFGLLCLFCLHVAAQNAYDITLPFACGFEDTLVENKNWIMKQKKTISQKLAKRKYRPPLRIIAWIYHFVMLKIVGRKYNAKFHIIDKVKDCDGPCFVIFNHLSRIDHLYVMGACYPRITNMMAGYSEFYRAKFSFIFGLNKVIPKKNYAADALPIRAVSKV